VRSGVAGKWRPAACDRWVNSGHMGRGLSGTALKNRYAWDRCPDMVNIRRPDSSTPKKSWAGVLVRGGPAAGRAGGEDRSVRHVVERWLREAQRRRRVGHQIGLGGDGEDGRFTRPLQSPASTTGAGEHLPLIGVASAANPSGRRRGASWRAPALRAPERQRRRPAGGGHASRKPRSWRGGRNPRPDGAIFGRYPSPFGAGELLDSNAEMAVEEAGTVGCRAGKVTREGCVEGLVRKVHSPSRTWPGDRSRQGAGRRRPFPGILDETHQARAAPLGSAQGRKRRMAA